MARLTARAFSAHYSLEAHFFMVNSNDGVRAYFHGGGGPQVGEVTRLAVGGVTRLGGLPSLSGRVTLSAA